MLDQMFEVDRDIYLANNNSPQLRKIWDLGGGRDGRSLDKDFLSEKLHLKKCGFGFYANQIYPCS